MTPTLTVAMILLVVALGLLAEAQRRLAVAVVELRSVTSGLSSLRNRAELLDERSLAASRRHGDARRALARQPRR